MEGGVAREIWSERGLGNTSPHGKQLRGVERYSAWMHNTRGRDPMGKNGCNN